MNKYQELGNQVGELVGHKQEAYGDAFNKAGRCLEQLFPDGIKKEQYTDLLCIVRILDKLFRVANGEPGGLQDCHVDQAIKSLNNV